MGGGYSFFFFSFFLIFSPFFLLLLLSLFLSFLFLLPPYFGVLTALFPKKVVLIMSPKKVLDEALLYTHLFSLVYFNHIT